MSIVRILTRTVIGASVGAVVGILIQKGYRAYLQKQAEKTSPAADKSDTTAPAPAAPTTSNELSASLSGDEHPWVTAAAKIGHDYGLTAVAESQHQLYLLALAMLNYATQNNIKTPEQFTVGQIEEVLLARDLISVPGAAPAAA